MLRSEEMRKQQKFPCEKGSETLQQKLKLFRYEELTRCNGYVPLPILKQRTQNVKNFKYSSRCT